MAYTPPVPDVVNAANSSTATLTGGSTFTGTSIDLSATAVSKVTVEAFSDQASALGGLQLQFSTDNSNWDYEIKATVSASVGTTLVAGVLARYCRVVYTNGSVGQGSFRLQTLLSSLSIAPTTKSINTLVTGSDAAQMVRSVLSGKANINTSNYTDVLTDVYGSLQTVLSGESSDAFGRGRISNPTSLFNVSFEYDAQPLLMQILNAGTGTTTKTSNVSSLTLITGGTASGAGTILQSHAYLRYEPGKSQLIQMTGVIGAAKANVRSQIGYYDVNNGVFFDQNDGINVTVRTNTSGSPVDTAISQANWNLDKMDGTGISGITLDFTKAQIFVIDFQWLGEGRIRFGFSINGQVLYCHQVLNANNISLPFMNTANLPVRWEIHNTSTAASTTSMIAGCASVISEGGQENPKALQFSAQNARAGISVSGISFIPVISIQPATTVNSITNRGKYTVISIDVMDSSTNGAAWVLIYNPTLTNSSFAAFNATDSGMNVDTTASALSGGVVVASGFVAGGGHSEVEVDLTNLKVYLGLDIAGTTADIFTLACLSTSGTVSINGSITWTEER